MSDRARTAYEEWNLADVRAREAESRLGEAWQAYFDGAGSPPDQGLIAEVARLRALAHERLTAAMAAINTQRRAHAG